nr:tryptophan halogenase family protein [Caulobacter sp. X]
MRPEHFLILGGGTAGWMAALLFERAFPGSQITLVESSEVGTIGVGEGSTPALKAFFGALGISEADWMPRCNATYKSGIRFTGWSGAPGFEGYFHPFLTHFDRDHIKALEHNSKLRRAGVDVHAHPDLFCYSYYLADRRLCPATPRSFPFSVQYGYHFSAGLLAAYLREVALARGVVCHDARISSVDQDADGDVTHVTTNDGQVLAADFFVDCSGFASVIAKKALGAGWRSYGDALFNDTAVTIATPREPILSSQTTSTALRHGWAWRIPQQDRVGNGYVFSSKYCSPEDAERELRAHLGLGPEDGEARTVPFKSGRLETFWNRNTLAVGLSQGFLEPLEATALALVQLTLVRFVKAFGEGGGANAQAHLFNQEIAAAFDGVKDYIHTHFITSDRRDTPYWRDCAANGAAVSPRLRAVLETWFAGGDLAETLNAVGLDRHYKLNSWLYILSGMGVYPPHESLRPPRAEELQAVPLDSIRGFFECCSLNHVEQARALENLAAGQPPMAGMAGGMTQAEAMASLLGLGFASSGHR